MCDSDNGKNLLFFYYIVEKKWKKNDFMLDIPKNRSIICFRNMKSISEK